MKRILWTDVFLFLIACIVCAGGNALAANYVFTNIADTTTPGPVGTLRFEGDYVSPTVANGVVAFQARYSLAETGIFIGSGGALTTIAKTGDTAPSGSFSNFRAIPSISFGRIAFGASFGSGQKGIFVSSGGLVTTIAKTGDLGPLGTYMDVDQPVISGDRIAFWGQAGDAVTDAIFVSTGGAVTPIVKLSDATPSGGTFSSIELPAISGNRVAFEGASTRMTASEVVKTQGIYVSDGTSLTTIVENGQPAPVGTFFLHAHKNISGSTVAFSSLFGDSAGSLRWGLFTGDTGTLSVIAKGGDPAPTGVFSEFGFGVPSISGDIVGFVANYGEDVLLPSERGIFISDGGSPVPVIKSGDLLFGSIVTNVYIGPANALDADGSGRIAFGYRLANGLEGIALGTPVPEPATFMLLLIGLHSVKIMTRVRRN
jgi:hypothetical protein